ncbi:sensor histidine kinase KdpD [uncultured Pseudoflavonifractor sp.]|uniref:sensor histidine kinase n=1 Tax=uncultured Pseudoflavonifractor sp. TaxID=1221379 RepID=UPI0025F171E6|nr:HAMP domain-containing sensor histidine kinase [uncultured Pseudoflavonifractor sp.]
MPLLILALIVLGALCVGLGIRVYAVERALRSAAGQLREREKTGSSARILMAAPNSSAEQLISAVNGLLELRQAEEADYCRREKALRQQIANVSHDLRTPLTSIIGYLQLLEGDGLTPGEREEYLSIIEGRARALQSLIGSFYDLSRLDGGEYPIARERVDLYAILSELVAGFYNDLTASGLDVSVDLAEGLPLVWGDAAAVLRVFTNLIRNALEHGVGTLSIRLYRAGDTVVSAFSNGAGGLTEEDVPHVFDRSFTSDKNRTSHNAGLGLAIVKALAEQMGCRTQASLEGPEFVIRVFWKTAGDR